MALPLFFRLVWCLLLAASCSPEWRPDNQSSIVNWSVAPFCFRVSFGVPINNLQVVRGPLKKNRPRTSPQSPLPLRACPWELRVLYSRLVQRKIYIFYSYSFCFSFLLAASILNLKRQFLCIFRALLLRDESFRFILF